MGRKQLVALPCVLASSAALAQQSLPTVEVRVDSERSMVIACSNPHKPEMNDVERVLQITDSKQTARFTQATDGGGGRWAARPEYRGCMVDAHRYFVEMEAPCADRQRPAGSDRAAALVGPWRSSSVAELARAQETKGAIGALRASGNRRFAVSDRPPLRGRRPPPPGRGPPRGPPGRGRRRDADRRRACRPGAGPALGPPGRGPRGLSPYGLKRRDWRGRTGSSARCPDGRTGAGRAGLGRRRDRAGRAAPAPDRVRDRRRRRRGTARAARTTLAAATGAAFAAALVTAAATRTPAPPAAGGAPPGLLPYGLRGPRAPSGLRWPLGPVSTPSGTYQVRNAAGLPAGLLVARGPLSWRARALRLERLATAWPRLRR